MKQRKNDFLQRFQGKINYIGKTGLFVEQPASFKKKMNMDNIITLAKNKQNKNNFKNCFNRKQGNIFSSQNFRSCIRKDFSKSQLLFPKLHRSTFSKTSDNKKTFQSFVSKDFIKFNLKFPQIKLPKRLNFTKNKPNESQQSKRSIIFKKSATSRVI